MITRFIPALRKPLGPIISKLLPSVSVTLVRFLQLQNASVPISLTLAGIVTLDLSVLEPLLSDLLNSFWNDHLSLPPEVPEKLVSDHR